MHTEIRVFGLFWLNMIFVTCVRMYSDGAIFTHVSTWLSFVEADKYAIRMSPRLGGRMGTSPASLGGVEVVVVDSNPDSRWEDGPEWTKQWCR